MIHNLIVTIVFAGAIGASVATICNHVADAWERWTHPAPREEVFHLDMADWYPEDAE